MNFYIMNHNLVLNFDDNFVNNLLKFENEEKKIKLKKKIFHQVKSG